MASYNDRDRETRTTLYVAGFHPQTRAYDLAEVFERCGKLVRCDIPASRNLCNQSIAFVEFQSPADARFAWETLHQRRFYDGVLDIQWARRQPSERWRYEESYAHRRYERSPTPPSRHRYRSPSLSDRRHRSPSPRRYRSPSPPPRYSSPRRNGDRDWKDYDPRDGGARRDKSPPLAAPTAQRENGAKDLLEYEDQWETDRHRGRDQRAGAFSGDSCSQRGRSASPKR